MKDNDKKNILAVQTLRNNIMGSTLMATTAILLCSATAVFMGSAYFSTKQPLLGGDDPKLLGFKYLTLILCFIFSFFSYSQSIRYINHVNFLVNIPLPDAMAIRISPEYVSNVLAKGCNFFTAGTRGYYFALPLLLWLFSPVAVLCGCVLLIPVLFFLDSADLDSDDEFLRKHSFPTGMISMAPPRPLNGASGVPNFRGCHELRKTKDGNILLTACSDHWGNSDTLSR